MCLAHIVILLTAMTVPDDPPDLQVGCIRMVPPASSAMLAKRHIPPILKQ